MRERRADIANKRDVIVSLVVAFCVCGMTYALKWMDNGVLRQLIAAEDRIFDNLVERPITMAPWASPVVFVDIDQAAVEAAARPDSNFGETPRALVAALISAAAKEDAAVIYVDLDMRGKSDDDDQITQAIKDARSSVILLPSFFATGLLSPCDRQSAPAAPRETGHPFADVIDASRVRLVHSVVSIGPYSVIEGVCSFYDLHAFKTKNLVARPAAMAAAVDVLPNHTPVGLGEARLLPSRWVAGPSDEVVSDSGGRLAYAHIRAGLLINRDPELAGKSNNRAVLRGSIVVIGSSHDAAEDVQPSPYGPMPGALVQANMGLALEAVEPAAMGTPMQILVDVLLACIAGTMSYRLYGVVKSKVARSIGDVFITIFVGVTVFVMLVTTQRSYAGVLAGWRFGLLSCLSGALAALLIQGTNMLGEYVADRLIKSERP